MKIEWECPECKFPFNEADIIDLEDVVVCVHCSVCIELWDLLLPKEAE